jgi:hypothetical protein
MDLLTAVILVVSLGIDEASTRALDSCLWPFCIRIWCTVFAQVLNKILLLLCCFCGGNG